MPKVKTTVVIDEELYHWLKEQIKKMRFYNDSHGINVALKKLKDEENSKK